MGKSKSVASMSAELPPERAESEAALLGCLLNEGRDFTLSLADVLEPADFFLDKYGVIFDAALALARRGEQVDQTTVLAELQRHHQDGLVGGAVGLSLLVRDGLLSIPANAQTYAKAIREASIKRVALAYGLAIIEHARNGTEARAVVDELGATHAMLAARLAGHRDGLGEPDVTSECDDLRVTWPGYRVTFTVQNLRESGDGISAELIAERAGREVHDARLPLASSQARAAFVKACEQQAPSTTWAGMVQRACRLGIVHARRACRA